MRIGVPDLVSNSYFPALAAVPLGFLRGYGNLTLQAVGQEAA